VGGEGGGEQGGHREGRAGRRGWGQWKGLGGWREGGGEVGLGGGGCCGWWAWEGKGAGLVVWKRLFAKARPQHVQHWTDCSWGGGAVRRGRGGVAILQRTFIWSTLVGLEGSRALVSDALQVSCL